MIARTDSNATTSRLTAWLLAGAALVLLAMAMPMLMGQVYVADDLGQYHLPLRQFYSQQLKAGQAFDWLPSLFGGYYLTGEGQAGTYHPLHWLLYRLLPLDVAFDLELLMSYPLMLAGEFVLLRRWRLRPDAALLGAAAFTFSGFNLLHFIHPNAVALIAHWPWMLWALDWALVDRADAPRAGAPSRAPVWAWPLVSLNLGSQLLIGYPQYVWLGMLVAVPYALVCLKISAAPRTGRLAALVFAAAVGVLIGGAQLLPTVDALADSNRENVDTAFATSGSLHPLNLIQVVAPYLFQTRVVGQNTHELGLYFGAVPLLLALWLVFNRQMWGNCRPLVVGALWTIAIGLLLAFGGHGVGSLQHWLPVVGKFRFPCRAIALVYGGVALLAAVAWQRLVDPKGTERPGIAKLAWKALAVSILVAVAACWMWSGFLGSLIVGAIGPSFFAAAALAFRAMDRGWRVAPILLALITLVDLSVYGLSYAVFDTDRLDHFAQAQNMPPSAERPIVAAPVVVAPIDDNVAPSPPDSAKPDAGEQVGNQLLLAGFRRMDGYAGLVPRRQLDFTDPLALRIAGVGYRAVEGTEGYDPPIKWLAVENPLPVVRLVTRAIVDHGGPLPAESAEPHAALVAEPLDLPAAAAGTIGDLVERPGHLALSVDTDTRQLLVFNQSFHSGWRAKVDGQTVPVLPVNRDFMSVVVTPGRKAVTLDFRPFSLLLGRASSTLGLGLWCAQWVVAAWWAGRRVADCRSAGHAGKPQSLAADSSLA